MRVHFCFNLSEHLVFALLAQFTWHFCQSAANKRKSEGMERVAEEMIISSKGTSCCPASTTSPGISFFMIIMQCQIYLKFWHGTDHALSIGRTPILTLIRPLSPLSSVYSLSFPAPFRLRRRGLCVPSIAPHMQTLTTDRKKTWHLATRGCCLRWSAKKVSMKKYKS